MPLRVFKFVAGMKNVGLGFYEVCHSSDNLRGPGTFEGMLEGS